MTVKINDREIKKLLDDTSKREEVVKTLVFNDVITSELFKILFKLKSNIQNITA